MTSINVGTREGLVEVRFTGPDFKKRFGHKFIFLPLTTQEALDFATALVVQSDRVARDRLRRALEENRE